MWVCEICKSLDFIFILRRVDFNDGRDHNFYFFFPDKMFEANKKQTLNLASDVYLECRLLCGSDKKLLLFVDLRLQETYI